MPGQEDDSFLLLGDGEHLPLGKIRNTRALSFKGIDLLTLSACQTARGTDGNGAEIDGFGTTAQLNGAGAVMASLWPVSDAATPLLMRDFYAGIMQNGLDKAEALRQAQIKMLHSTDSAVATIDRAAAALDAPEPKAKAGFDHPYFWSAFVLMGNWQ
jgi:CHAT domain-containing protein